MTRPLAAWLALVVPVWLVFVLCTYWEPIMRDGWGHAIWHLTHDVSLGTLWEFGADSFLYRNPRLGQVFTLVQHTPGVWHPLITPILELGLFYLLATLALGRRPSLRRIDDALLCATLVAMVFACTRSLGLMLFYRPWTGNYVFGLVVCLAWLVPYRLHGEQPRKRGWWWTPIMAVLGVAAGLCNEHTGPAFIAAGVLAIVVYWRRGERFVPWAWAGLLAIVAGSLLLFYAPGQEVRYAGLATQQSLLERVVDRGVTGNGVILVLLPLYLLPLALWWALVVSARRRSPAPPQPGAAARAGLVALGMAVLIGVTLLASPKQGDRLYFASICLASAAAAAWVVPQLGSRERRVAAVLAAIVIAWVGWRAVSAYHQRAREFAVRMTAIENAAPGSTIEVPRYSQERSQYVLGDDFRFPWVRARAAAGYGLAAIELESSGGDDQREPTTSSPDDEP